MNHERSIWDEDENYPAKDWQYEVANGDTRLGYWEWVYRSSYLENMDELED